MKKGRILLILILSSFAVIFAAATGCESNSQLLELKVDIKGNGVVHQLYTAKPSAGYGNGSIVMLTAKPAHKWEFSHWEGGLTGIANPAEITITKPTTVTAVFDPVELPSIPAEPTVAWCYQSGSFMPSDAFSTKHNPDLYENPKDTPQDYDVLVIDEIEFIKFNVTDFTGKVIVTLDSGIKKFLEQMLDPESDDVYWDYGTSANLLWTYPTPGEEVGANSDARVYHALDEVTGFVRRASVIQASSSNKADDVILYTIDSDLRSWYWLHIGPHFGDYSDAALASHRCSEIIDYVLELLAGEEPEFPPLPEPDPEV